MTWLVLVLAVVLVGLTVAAVLGRDPRLAHQPTRSLAYVPLPEDRLTPDDLDGIRLDTGLRGYRMDQVDEVIGRLTEEIGELRASLEVARHAAATSATPAGNGATTPYLRPGPGPAVPDGDDQPDAPAGTPAHDG